jgi:hypothetical protein
MADTKTYSRIESRSLPIEPPAPFAKAISTNTTAPFDHLACPPKPWRRRMQAARSGKQNIIEGSMASGTSKETEIKLTHIL